MGCKILFQGDEAFSGTGILYAGKFRMECPLLLVADSSVHEETKCTDTDVKRVSFLYNLDTRVEGLGV